MCLLNMFTPFFAGAIVICDRGLRVNAFTVILSYRDSVASCALARLLRSRVL